MAEDFEDDVPEDSGDQVAPAPATEDDFPDTLPPDAFARSAPKGDDFPDTLPANAFSKEAPKEDEFPDFISDRQFQKSAHTSTPAGAAYRHAVTEAPSAVGGLGVGLGVGARVGAALAPAGPVVAGLGGVAAGLAAGMGAGALIGKGEDALIKLLGLDQDDESVFSKRQARTDQSQHPYASEAGSLAPAALLLRPTGKMAERALGAGIAGVAGAGQQLYENGEIDPGKLAMQAAFGGVFPNANALGEKFMPGNGKPGAAPNPETRGLAGPPDRPMIQGPDGSPERPLNGEVLEPDVQQIPYKNDGRYASQIEQAIAERNKFPQEHIGYRLWNEQVARLQSMEDGKGWSDVDASQGPRSEDNPFTWQDADLANDVTTTAKGVAAENGPAPKIKGAGNPVGAPMEAREAARPRDPQRNYGKDTLAAANESSSTAPSTKISTAPIHEDIAAALTHEQSPTVQDNGGAQVAPRPRVASDVPSILNPEASKYDTQTAQILAANKNVPGRANTAGDVVSFPRPTPEPRENALSQPMPEPRENALAAPEPEPKVTATETRPRDDLIQNARQALQERGMNKALELFDRIQDPERKARIASDALANLTSKGGEAIGSSEIRKPVPRESVTEGGPMARTRSDAEHKAGVLAAHHDAVARFGEAPANETPVARRARLQQMVSHVDEQAKKLVADLREKYPNEKPAKFTGKYRPAQKSEAMTLVKAARDVLKVPSKKNTEALAAAEAMLKGEKGKAAAEEDYKNLVQETNRINAEIEKKPNIPEAAAEAMIQRARSDEPSLERRPHEPFDNSKGLEPATFKGEHDDLTNWLNHLTDEDHALLMQEHPDLHLTVEGTNQPKKLMAELQDTLIEAEQKAAEKAEAAKAKDMAFEAAPAEDQPVIRRAKVTSREELPGRVLDKNSPEFKRIAEEALKDDKVRMSPEERLAAEQERTARETQAENEPRSALDLAKDFFKDSSGSVPVPDWAKKFAKYMWGPHADPAAIEYGKGVGMMHTKMRNFISQAYRNALVNAQLAMQKAAGKYVPTAHEFGQIYRAMEKGARDSLSAKQRAFAEKYIDPVFERAARDYDKLRELSIKNKLQGWDTMPERKNNGAGFAQFMFRRLRLDPRATDQFEPITNKSSLSNWAASAMERDWFVLHNPATGARTVYHVNEDGDVVVYKNHKMSAAKTMPSSFDPRDIGAKIKFNGAEHVVDHAKIDELMTHGNGKDGKPLRYSDNPLYVVSDAYIGLKAALERVKLLDKLVNDPEFQNLRARNSAAADAKFGVGNHAETALPQFKGSFFPKPLAWALDDMVRTGFHYDADSAMGYLSRFSQAMLKPFYFLGPEVHVLNELDKFIIGRGLWANTVGLPSLAKHFMRGLRSVRAQDAMQKDIVQAGGNPMFVHSLVSRVSEQIGKIAGEDMVARPWKYDPLNKLFGIDSKERSHALMRASNKMMWWQSDVLYSTMFGENRTKLGWKESLPEAEKQRINKEAVRLTEHVVDSYVVPTTMGKTLGLEHTQAGRELQKVLSDPALSAFGRYHYGNFHMLAQVVKNMMGPDSSMSQRLLGVSQAAMLYAMTAYVYPQLSAAYQAVTGDKHSELEKRGLTRMVNTPFQKDKSLTDLTRSVWTMSPALDTVSRMYENKDFTGKKQFDASGGVGRVPGQAADFALSQFASPLAAASRGYNQKGAGYAGQKFIESNFGLKTPSPKAQNYERHREQYRQRDAIQRERNPRGVFEAINNKFIQRR